MSRLCMPTWLTPAVLFLFSYGMRLLYLRDARRSPLFASPLMDAAYHDHWARRLAAGGWLGNEVFFRAPLYPYFLGVLYRLFGPDYVAVRLVQFAVGSLTCVLVYWLGKRAAGHWTGVVAGAGAAGYGPFVYYDGELLLPVLEVLFAAAMLLALLHAVDAGQAVELNPARTGRQTRTGPWFTVGIFAGLFALTRPNILAFVPVLLALAWWTRRGRAVVACLAGVLLCVLPVTVRNYEVGRDFVLISSQAGVNFYIGNNPQSDGVTAVVPGTRATWWGGYRDAVTVAQRASARSLRPSEVSAYWFRRAFIAMRDAPRRWLRLTTQKAVLFWNGFELSNNVQLYLAAWVSPVLRVLMRKVGPVWIPFGVVAPLALVGTGLAIRRRHLPLLILTGYVFVYAATVIAFFVCGRYRLPIVPALLVLAAFALVELVSLAGRRAWCTLGFGLCCTALVAVAVNHDYYGTWRFDRAQMHLDYANAYQQKGDLAAAEREFRAALRAAPTRLENQVGLALCLVARKQPKEARRLFEQVLTSSPRRWEALVGLGDVCVLAGDDAKAEAWYRKAIAVDPLGTQAYLRLGDCLNRRGKQAEARQVYAAGCRGVPGEEALRLALAQAALARKDYTEAARICEQLVHQGREPVAARALLAGAYLNLGEFVRAQRLADAVLKAAPHNAAALTVAGYCAGREGDLRRALASFRAAVKADPDSADAWTALATHAVMAHDATTAWSAATRAVALDPANPIPRFVKAGCYYDRHDYDQATAECRTILKLHPDFRPARDMLRQLERRKTTPSADVSPGHAR